jgi:hypothetical protein
MENNSIQTTAERIIAARFGTTAEAEAVAQSMHGFIAAKDICIFHNNAPGQHGTTMFGDHVAEHQHAANATINSPNAAIKMQSTQLEPNGEVAEQAEHAEGSAMATAAVAGVAAGVLAVAAGPVVALAAVGVAAYTGSLAGALEGSNVDENGEGSAQRRPAMRQGGVMIAVHIVNTADQARVVQALKSAGAADIEQAEGKWQDGDWVDFDPLAAPELVKV